MKKDATFHFSLSPNVLDVLCVCDLCVCSFSLPFWTTPKLENMTSRTEEAFDPSSNATRQTWNLTKTWSLQNGTFISDMTFSSIRVRVGGVLTLSFSSTISCRDFRKPPTGWGYRQMLELEDAELDRDIDDRPGFLVRKGDVSVGMATLLRVWRMPLTK